jgi:hypothetical protein
VLLLVKARLQRQLIGHAEHEDRARPPPGLRDLEGP